jgi:hypothetical protein
LKHFASLRLKLKIHYDERWAKTFGNESAEVARQIVARTQNIFEWPSLTTKIIFEIDPHVNAIPVTMHKDSFMKVELVWLFRYFYKAFGLISY